MSDQSNTYIVIFQLAKLENRKQLREALKEYKIYCPLSNSSWAINTAESATSVRDTLKANMEEGDRLYVIKTNGEAAWKNSISQKHSDWLKKYL